MRIQHRFFVALIAGTCAFGSIAHAEVVFLQDLEANATLHRPQAEISRARIAQGSAQIDRAKSAYMPVVSAGVNASLAPGRELVELTDSAGNKTGVLVSGSKPLGDSSAFNPQPRYGLTLGVRGNLYDFGRTSSLVQAARAQHDAAQAVAREGSQQLLEQVRAAYVRWAAAYALSQITAEGTRSAVAREERTAGLIEEGVRPAADRLSAAQETAVAKLEAERAAEELDAARIDLGFMVARELGPDAQPDPALLAGTPAAAAPDATAVENVDALERSRAAAVARARVQEHAISPVISFDASTGLQGQTSDVFPVYSVGIGISAALWDGGAASAGAAEARAEAAEFSARSAEAKAQKERGAARVKSAQQFAARRLALAQQALELASAQVAQLQEGSAVDAATFRAQASAEAASLRARKEVVLAQAAYAQARLGLIEH